MIFGYGRKSELSSFFQSTLNLCLEMPDNMQKSRNWFMHRVIRKHPKCYFKMTFLNLDIFLIVFGRFLNPHDNKFLFLPNSGPTWEVQPCLKSCNLASWTTKWHGQKYYLMEPNTFWISNSWCMEGVLRVSGSCLEGVWNILEKCLEGVWRVHPGYKDGV